MSTQQDKPGTARAQRKWRNLLLDPPFQLKYAGYLVAVALLLGGTLGAGLWKTSQELLVRGEQSVKQSEQIVSLGRELLEESQKVSTVVRLSMQRDPLYQEDPELLAAFNEEAAAQKERLDQQKARLVEQAEALNLQEETLRTFAERLKWSLAAGLLCLVLALACVGIVVTHKLAGPLFKMQRHLQQIQKGNWQLPSGLRKGDDLQGFFETFRETVRSLRRERAEHWALVRQAIDAGGRGESAEQQQALVQLEQLLANHDSSQSAQGE